MLTNLHIENVAVIENADVFLDSGFNILTGETGAGKSIIIDAINLILGERSSRELIRTSASRAHVSALFREISAPVLHCIQKIGFDCDEEGNLVIEREVHIDGKGLSRVNGKITTVSQLREIGKYLVSIHGQHDNQALLLQENHLKYLDRFAECGELFNQYRHAFDQYTAAENAYRDLMEKIKEKNQRMDLLEYQLQDIRKAALVEGEEEELTAQRAIMANAEKIVSAVQSAYECLYGEEGEGAQTLLSQAGDALNDAAFYYEGFAPLAEKTRNMAYEAQEIASEIHAFSDTMDYDSGTLDQVEQRLDLIYRLKNKYGKNVSELLLYADQIEEELSQFEHADAHLSILQEKKEIAYGKALQLAKKLTEIRKKAGVRMAALVKKELEFLDMPHTTFVVDIQSPAGGRLMENGIDRVEFFISANLGEAPKPLLKTASGGELSRVMLTIKNVLMDKDEIDTLIFDEVDAGVSGRAAQKIGIKLRQVSRGKQILCVSHLAQIAVYADSHMLIEKNVRNGKTYTSLRQLDFEERKHEIARITSGTNITEAALLSAEEMLHFALDNGEIIV